MNKLIEKIKRIINKINIFDEERADGIPETVPGIAKYIAKENGYGSVEEIEAILREGQKGFQRQTPQKTVNPRSIANEQPVERNKTIENISRKESREVDEERDDR